jgi:hypothetical protein
VNISSNKLHLFCEKQKNSTLKWREAGTGLQGYSVGNSRKKMSILKLHSLTLNMHLLACLLTLTSFSLQAKTVTDNRAFHYKKTRNRFLLVLQTRHIRNHKFRHPYDVHCTVCFPYKSNQTELAFPLQPTDLSSHLRIYQSKLRNQLKKIESRCEAFVLTVLTWLTLWKLKIKSLLSS